LNGRYAHRTHYRSDGHRNYSTPLKNMSVVYVWGPQENGAKGN